MTFIFTKKLIFFQQYFIGLEKEAQIWAEQCKMDHDGAYQRYQPGLCPVSFIFT